MKACAISFARCTIKLTARSLKTSIQVEQLTCSVGAELRNVDLGAASRDADTVAEIRALLLKHKVLFFRDQEMSRDEHVTFARDSREVSRSADRVSPDDLAAALATSR